MAGRGGIYLLDQLGVSLIVFGIACSHLWEDDSSVSTGIKQSRRRLDNDA